MLKPTIDPEQVFPQTPVTPLIPKDDLSQGMSYVEAQLKRLHLKKRCVQIQLWMDFNALSWEIIDLQGLRALAKFLKGCEPNL